MDDILNISATGEGMVSSAVGNTNVSQSAGFSPVSGDFFQMLISQLSTSMNQGEQPQAVEFLLSQLPISDSEGNVSQDSFKVLQEEFGIGNQMMPFPLLTEETVSGLDEIANILSQQESLPEWGLLLLNQLQMLQDSSSGFVQSDFSEVGMVDTAISVVDEIEAKLSIEAQQFESMVPFEAEGIFSENEAVSQKETIKFVGQSLLEQGAETKVFEGNIQTLSSSEIKAQEQALVNATKNSTALEQQLLEQQDRSFDSGDFIATEEQSAGEKTEQFIEDFFADSQAFLETLQGSASSSTSVKEPVADNFELSKDASVNVVEERLGVNLDLLLDGEESSNFAHDDSSVEMQKLFDEESDNFMKTDDVQDSKDFQALMSEKQKQVSDAKTIAEQLVKSAQLRQTPQVSEFKLSLEPSSLGSLRVSVSVEGDSVVTKIVADNPDTQSLLADSIGILKEAFDVAGIESDNIEVSFEEETQNFKDFDEGARPQDGEKSKQGSKTLDSHFFRDDFDEVLKEGVPLNSDINYRNELHQINYLI